MDFEQIARDFTASVDELRRSITVHEIAKECGVTLESIQNAMLEEDSKAYVPPPRFWQGDLACLARERAEELVELADELEACAWAPATEEELEEIGSMILSKFDEILQPGAELAEVGNRREAIEDRLAEIEARREEVEARRAERAKLRDEELDELNAMFLRGIQRD